MLGIIVILLISWILLHFFEKENLLSLGFLPIFKRLKQFIIGFLVTSIMCVGVQYLEAFLKSSEWMLNSNFSFGKVVQYFYWDFKSVLTEELVFRGAILYILIKKIGSSKAILLSAILFGIYHWFSFGVFGNIMAMIFVFIGTGTMGYAWALAFSKTKSILLPLGLHLGWNFTINTIFSKGPLGEGLLLSQGGEEITQLFSLVGLCLIPVLVLIYVLFLVSNEKVKINDESIDQILTMDNETDMVIKIGQSIWSKCEVKEDLNFDSLNEFEKTVILIDLLEGQVNNGGFDQYFFNSSGNFAIETLKALEEINAPFVKGLLQEAINNFPKIPFPASIEERRMLMKDLPESISIVWGNLDEKYYRENPENLANLVVGFVKRNKKYFE